MPAKRLPWFKVWPECIKHPKVAMLTDGEFRTWLYVLAEASQQRPVRWRFESLRHVSVVTGRSEKHIKVLERARLLDFQTDGVWVHDWKDWQDRFPSDYSGNTAMNTPGTLPEDSCEHSEYAAGTVPVDTEERSTTGPNGPSVDPEAESESESANADAPRRPAPVDDFEFQRFWETYPKNDGSKKVTRQRWLRLSVADRNDALIGAKNYAVCKRVGEGFVKYAEAWIGERRWEAYQVPESPGNGGSRPPLPPGQHYASDGKIWTEGGYRRPDGEYQVAI